MFPTIDKRATGINLRRLMDERGITVKDVQKFLGLGCVQSVYRWLDGVSMPTIDHLYALSELLQVSIDAIVCGNKNHMYQLARLKQIIPEKKDYLLITGKYKSFLLRKN